MQILPSRSYIQVDTHGVSPQFPRCFGTGLHSLNHSYRENLMEKMFGCWFAIPCDCGDLCCGLRLRGNSECKKTCKQVLSSSECHSAHSMMGKQSSFQEGKASTKSVFFELLSCNNCFTSKTWNLQACSEELNSRVRAMCLPALSEPYKHIPRA